MSKLVSRALYSGVLTLLAVSFVFAQTERELAVAAAGDKYVISAKAGGVNFVEGSVGIVRKAGKSGQLLQRDEIAIGDRVSTGQDGKAEILLNPGSYLRIGPNTAFEFRTTSLDDLQIRLDSGSAILEVFAANEFKVTVFSPKAKYTMLQSGVYRIDVPANHMSTIEVWEGLAQIGDSTANVIKKGRTASVSNGNATVAKFDRGERDAFETWSRERGKLLAKNASRLKNRDMRTALMRSALTGGWGMYNSFGLWIYDASLRAFCFLPFGRWWSSPYGYGYGNSYWWYQIPTVTVVNPPVVVGNGPTITPIVTAGTRLPTPPFIRMEQIGGGGNTGSGRMIQDSSGWTPGNTGSGRTNQDTSGWTPGNTGSRSSDSSTPPPPPPSETGAKIRP